jgi:hypothetical protein
MIQRYAKDKGGDVYGAFNWIAAIAATDPTYFNWIRVTYEVTEEGDGKNIQFTETKKYEDSNMQMASGDVQHLAKRKAAIVKAMKHAVRDSKHSRCSQKDSPMIRVRIKSWFCSSWKTMIQSWYD